MEAEIKKDGVLVIRSTTELESFALSKWYESAAIRMTFDQRTDTYITQLRAEKLVVDASYPGVSDEDTTSVLDGVSSYIQ